MLLEPMKTGWGKPLFIQIFQKFHHIKGSISAVAFPQGKSKLNFPCENLQKRGQYTASSPSSHPSKKRSPAQAKQQSLSTVQTSTDDKTDVSSSLFPSWSPGCLGDASLDLHYVVYYSARGYKQNTHKHEEAISTLTNASTHGYMGVSGPELYPVNPAVSRLSVQRNNHSPVKTSFFRC